jgi:uncharacterized membrane protein YgcG
MRAIPLTCLFLAVGLLTANRAEAACTPSATKFCVSEQNFTLAIQGPTGNPVSRGEVNVYTGTAYTFELAETITAEPHNFALSPSATGPANQADKIYSTNVTGIQPISAEGESVVFTPAANQVGLALYYQCGVHSGMGGKINVLAGPAPVIGAGTPDAGSKPDAGSGSGGGGGGSGGGGGGGGSGAPGPFGCSATAGLGSLSLLAGLLFFKRHAGR